MYSAIKVKGKKLYEYARQGQKIEVQPRKIEIYNINLNKFDKINNEIIFTVECSKGVYIRTLCENIAEKLNCIGCMKELQRVQVGKFNISTAITIEELRQNKDNKEFLNKHIITFEKILENNEEIYLNDKQIESFFNGVKLKQNLEDGIYKIKNENGIFIGTGEVKNKFLKRDVIL